MARRSAEELEKRHFLRETIHGKMQEHGITQVQLAKRLGCWPNYLSRSLKYPHMATSVRWSSINQGVDILIAEAASKETPQQIGD